MTTLIVRVGGWVSCDITGVHPFALKVTRPYHIYYMFCYVSSLMALVICVLGPGFNSTHSTWQN